MTFNVRKATATLRYEPFPENVVHNQYGKRWIKLSALWQAHRSFMSVTLQEFEDKLKENTDRGAPRYLFASWDGEVWVCSVTQDERRDQRSTAVRAQQ